MTTDGTRERTVEVLIDDGATNYGTGYRISASLVLTCRHVVKGLGEPSIRLITESEDLTVPAERVWTAQGDKVDLALLAVPPSSPLPPVPPAELGGISYPADGRVSFRSWAFPRSHRSGEIRDIEQIDGVITLGSHLRTGRLDLHRFGAPQRTEKQNMGASGAPILVNGLLAGVVVWVESDGRLLGLRTSTVAGPPDHRDADYTEPSSSRDDFQKLLREAGVWLPPRIIDSPKATPQARYRPTIEKMAARCKNFAGREDERSQVDAFVLSSTSYMWWIGKPFSGKTAFSAQIAVHPPENTDVVAYFVSRLEGTRLDDFRKAVADQLALIAGLPPDRYQNPSGFDIDDLWQRAAEQSASQGRQLLLVVDALDEDDHHQHGDTSIASQLPEACPPGSHVLVTSRYAPDPRAVVGDSHPLHECLRRELLANEYSEASWTAVERDLNTYLHDSDRTAGRLHRELLGLLAAAGGHLTASDMKRLSPADIATSEIRHLMDRILGRLVEARDDLGESGYMFAHNLIHEKVIDVLGEEEINEHRQRIKEWARQSTVHGWTVETPAYLLVRYSRMLADTGDLDTLLTLHVPERYRLLHQRTGANDAALRDISDTLDLVSDGDVRGLATKLRLALWADLFKNAESNPPPQVPLLRARFGHYEKAERLARSCRNPLHRAQALTWVARELITSGDRDRGYVLLKEAESSADAINSSNKRAMALTEIARVLAIAGDRIRAEQLIRIAIPSRVEVPESESRDRELTGMMSTAAALDMPAVALDLAHEIRDDKRRVAAWEKAVETAARAGLIDTAEQIAAKSPIHVRADFLTMLIKYAAETDDHSRMDRLFDQLERISARRAKDREDIRGGAARAAADAGLFRQAERIAEMLTNPRKKAAATIGIAQAALERDDPARAVRTLDAVPAIATNRPAWLDLADLARAALASDDQDNAGRLLRMAMDVRASDESLPGRLAPLDGRLQLALETGATPQVTGLIDDAVREIQRYPKERWDELRLGIARLAAEKGLIKDAKRVAETIVGREERSAALVGMALSAAKAGAFEDAEGMARDIRESMARSSVLGTIASAAAAAGDLVLAERIAMSIPNTSPRNFALIDLVRVATVAGRLDDGERLATRGEFSSSFRRAQALAIVAEAAGEEGDCDKAEGLLSLAEHSSSGIPDRGSLSTPLAEIATAAAEVGQLQDAEMIASSIIDDARHARTLSKLAASAHRSRLHDQGWRLVAAANDKLRFLRDRRLRVETLIKMAQELAEAESHAHARWLLYKAGEATDGCTPHIQVDLLIKIAGALAGVDDQQGAITFMESAEKAALSIESNVPRAAALTKLVRRAEGICEQSYVRKLFKTAEQATMKLSWGWSRALGLASLTCSAVAKERNGKAGRNMLRTAMGIATKQSDHRSRGVILAHVAQASLQLGNPSYAARVLAEVEAITADIPEPAAKARVLAALCRSAAGADFLDRAGHIAITLAVSYANHSGLGNVAIAAATHGDHERARMLIAAAVQVAGTGTDPQNREKALASVARDATRAGLFDEAERIATGSLRFLIRRSTALTKIAVAAAARGEEETAGRLIAEAARAAMSATTPRSREMALVRLVKEAIRTGQLDEAERIATTGLDSPAHRAKALAKISVAAAGAGRFDDAEHMVAGITDRAARSHAMAAVAGAAIAAGEEDRARRMLRISMTNGAGIDLIVKLEPTMAQTISEVLAEIWEYVGGDDEPDEVQPRSDGE